MTKESVSSYTMQISQANASQLLCIAYSLWEDFAEEAIQAFADKSPEAFKQRLKKLQRVNQEIISMLNHENPYASNVIALHFFANRKIVESMLKKEPVELDRIKAMVQKLHAGFAEISRKDTDAPIMANTQQVYAGLTYGRGTLNESADPMGQAGRGFLA